jgi:hypothetical protein
MKFSAQFIITVIAVFSASVLTASAQQISEEKLKKNTTPVSNSLNYINRLQPVSYEYNNGEYKQLNLPAGTQFGFIASDAKEVAPWAITTRNSWYNAGKNNTRAVTTTEVDLQKLVPLLVGAIKEQQAEIKKLKQDVELLKQVK